ncbi:putative leucine-rich repeat-containing protein DDB_G0290503 [Onthophagus taurus]|uniref:putative leucine-rich repeat-containing protein DDB_G0290503 n=1 Tax=Onthophagus taurus TaxID=166361 RepID=UPI000C20393B|nr:uncharacterized protein LOC111426384 [Onthophagus taurus]XP_022916651.1 uncharacterized protein LOC111426384 [Onthophagus taurus]
MSSEKDDEINLVKMCGYLEKKGNKMKMMSSWKLKWFVLKGRLLLYYRSKDEYEACKGPCKGSINLGPNCIVKPLLGTSCVFQIETRAKTIILRAKNRLEQEKWLQSILSVLNQNQAASNIVGTQHFRYYSDELVPKQQQPKETGVNRVLTRQNTMPERFKLKKRQTFCGSLENVLSKTCEELEKSLNKKCLSTQNIEDTTIRKESEEVINDLYSTNEVDQKSGENNLNIYYRISTDSNQPKEGVSQENLNIYTKINDYVTQNEMDNIEKKNEEELVENDQYCTAAIKIIETKSNQYHEYNLPGRDNIYSVPNVDQNENKISKIDDVNPYSICDIFPKQKLHEESIYDTPIEVFDNKKGKIDELKSEEEKKPQLPKKVNFLKKFFKLKARKEQAEVGKSLKNDNEKLYEGDLVNKKVLEELQKLLVAKKASLQQQNQIKPDLATKRMLEELQNLLINKKEVKFSPINLENPPIPPQKQPETIYQEIPDSIGNIDNHTYANTALIKIDKILSDLDNMKKTSNPFSTGKVKSIIAKFNNHEINESKNDTFNVTLREKASNTSTISSKNSSDELNLLLSELVKVTNAPILTPGVTISLNPPPICYNDEFETDSSSITKRRHSEPDYDVPRPHSNLNIVKNEVDKDDVFVATRFFGPVLLNYDDFSNASTSITPDSLEISEASSYQSHYGKILKQPPYFLHKPNSNERKCEVNDKEDLFVDSLDAEGATFL